MEEYSETGSDLSCLPCILAGWPQVEAARRRPNGRILVHTGAIRAPNPREITMADKSPKKSTSKTAASKSLKEKRADKKSKAASKSNG